MSAPMSVGAPNKTRRRAWRRAGAGVVFVAALGLHAALLARASADPHARFGFQPFQESDTYQAEIVRVLRDGSVRPVDDGTWAHDWNELVGVAGLRSPWRTRHASGGADGVVDLLDRSLDWVIENTDDPDTVRLEATVTLVRNGGSPEVVELVGRTRTETP